MSFVDGFDRGGRRTQAAVWLLLVSAGCVLLMLAVDHVFVFTQRGQLVDSAALEGAGIGRERIIEPVHRVLDVVSVSSLAAAGLLAGAVALLRRRYLLAFVAVSVVVGSNVTTQLLKYHLLQRPDLGLRLQGMSGNTLPSGHTTVAMSVAAAFVLVAPARLRAVTALVAATYGAATGVATLSAGYHRPSDAIAACLVVGAWASALGALVVLVVPARSQEPRLASGHLVSASLLTAGAVVLIGSGSLAAWTTARSLPGELDRAQLLLAYVGGAAMIAGTALAVVASLVVVVHQIVPPLPERPLTRTEALLA